MLHYILKVVSSILILIVLVFSNSSFEEKQKQELAVIAYYAGNASGIDSFKVEKLTHIIYSFCHLKGNKLSVDNAADSATITKLVSLKAKHPKLKILLSLGGWCGCKECSDVFAKKQGRKEFAESTKQLTDYFKTDGLDLDWEYPGISGCPGHPFMPADKVNFTLLIEELRKALGNKHEVSFAAGGNKNFLDSSVEWNKVMPLIDRVNLMTYDLISGFSKVTGHHTPLYSTPAQQSSTDFVVNYLDSLGVPRNKMVIGAAFYARVFAGAENINNGLNQPAIFKDFVPYKRFTASFTPQNGYVFYRDEIAKAPYAYNAEKKLFATFDDVVSMKLKTQYALDKQLNGIMFWELTHDKTDGTGLLDAIYNTKQKR